MDNPFMGLTSLVLETNSCWRSVIERLAVTRIVLTANVRLIILVLLMDEQSCVVTNGSNEDQVSIMVQQQNLRLIVLPWLVDCVVIVERVLQNIMEHVKNLANRNTMKRITLLSIIIGIAVLQSVTHGRHWDGRTNGNTVV